LKSKPIQEQAILEERKLRTHLIRIYVVTIAGILAAMLAVVLLLSARELEQKNRESFQTLQTAICDDLQNGNVVSHSSLRKLENENNLMLRISDNGKTLLYNNLDDPVKQSLLTRAEETARAEGYDVSKLPLSNGRRTSPPAELREDGARYLCGVSIVPTKDGYRTLSAVQRIDRSGVWPSLLYCLSYLAGVTLLGWVGARLITRALQPAVESRIRQKQFIAAASHELRSPLAVIAANAAVLPEGARDSAAAGVIAAECGRMSRLIGDLLLLASADANTWTVQLGPLELDTLLLNVYEAYAPVYRTNGCALRLDLPEDTLPRVRGDGERLKQVLGILLENALTYGVTQEDRTVELTAVTQRQRAVICVVDHGVGLSAAQKARVFDRFYRGDASRGSKEHFGLGLSIARELVVLLKGSLELLDTPGGGCTFRISLN
jgi:hypothetical protein